MKKKIITIAAIGSFVLLTAAYTFFSTEKNQVNSLMLENIEALAQSEGSSFQNGPQKKYDCAGWFTGNGYRCAAEIHTNCVPIPCK